MSHLGDASNSPVRGRGGRFRGGDRGGGRGGGRGGHESTPWSRPGPDDPVWSRRGGRGGARGAHSMVQFVHAQTASSPSTDASDEVSDEASIDNAKPAKPVPYVPSRASQFRDAVANRLWKAKLDSRERHGEHVNECVNENANESATRVEPRDETAAVEAVEASRAADVAAAVSALCHKYAAVPEAATLLARHQQLLRHAPRPLLPSSWQDRVDAGELHLSVYRQIRRKLGIVSHFRTGGHVIVGMSAHHGAVDGDEVLIEELSAAEKEALVPEVREAFQRYRQKSAKKEAKKEDKKDDKKALSQSALAGAEHLPSASAPASPSPSSSSISASTPPSPSATTTSFTGLHHDAHDAEDGTMAALSVTRGDDEDDEDIGLDDEDISIDDEDVDDEDEDVARCREEKENRLESTAAPAAAPPQADAADDDTLLERLLKLPFARVVQVVVPSPFRWVIGRLKPVWHGSRPWSSDLGFMMVPRNMKMPHFSVRLSGLWNQQPCSALKADLIALDKISHGKASWKVGSPLPEQLDTETTTAIRAIQQSIDAFFSSNTFKAYITPPKPYSSRRPRPFHTGDQVTFCGSDPSPRQRMLLDAGVCWAPYTHVYPRGQKDDLALSAAKAHAAATAVAAADEADEAAMFHEGRRDFTAEVVFSVDPPTARDIDDALHCTRKASLPDGRAVYEVGVHIADVSHYVPPGTAMDTEAFRRGTSVYVLGSVISMLPEPLSSNRCSLMPSVPRRTMSVVWHMNDEGRIYHGEPGVPNIWIGRGVIRSHAKLAYRQAQDLIDAVGGTDGVLEPSRAHAVLPGLQPDVCVRVAAALHRMHIMSQHLRAHRYATGAVSLGSLDLWFERDADRNVVGCRPYEMLPSNLMIQELMILANKSVAATIYDALPDRALLRHHQPPRPAKLREAVALYHQKRGIDPEGPEGLCVDSSRTLHESLERITDDRHRLVANILLIKSMCLAAMVTTSTPQVLADPTFLHHYALNAPFYTYFTSPIRRYPDLVVHRQLNLVLHLRALYDADVLDPADRDALVAHIETRLLPSPVALQQIATRCNWRKEMATAAQDAHSLDALCRYLAREASRVPPADDPLAARYGILADALVYGINAKGVLTMVVPAYGLELELRLLSSRSKSRKGASSDRPNVKEKKAALVEIVKDDDSNNDNPSTSGMVKIRLVCDAAALLGPAQREKIDLDKHGFSTSPVTWSVSLWQRVPLRIQANPVKQTFSYHLLGPDVAAFIASGRDQEPIPIDKACFD